MMKDAPQLQTGTLAVQAPFFGAAEILTAKDLRNVYNYQDLRAKQFPPDAVDGTVVVPDLVGNPSRVLLAQVNYINGGVILSCAIHHCVVDETGFSNVMKLWSSFCRGDDGAALVTPEWHDRTPLMTGVGSGKLEEHPEYTLLPPERSATHASTSSEYISETSTTTGSAILFFSDESLKALKQAAVPESDPPATSGGAQEDAGWISTHDALCALLWTRVTQARNLGADVPYSVFAMTVNGRSRLAPPLPAEHAGNAVFVAIAALPLPALAAAAPALALPASTIRAAITAVDDRAIRAKIRAVTAVDDLGRLAPGGYSSAGRNLGCTSWVDQPYYALDWGPVLGGRCERLRWRSNISDGIFVIFPRVPATAEQGGGGGIEVYLGLQRECLERLRRDEVLGRFAEWRCVSC